MKTTSGALILLLLSAIPYGQALGADPLPTLEPTEIIKEPKEGWDYFFGGCSWYCGAPEIRFSATSFLKERSGLRHPAQQAHDRDMTKVWSEGVSGNGAGEQLTFTFVTTRENTTDLGITSCSIATGHQATKALFRKNSRPKTIQLIVDGKASAILKLKSKMGLQKFNIPKLALERPSTHTITLKILDTYPGTKFQDTCISEVYFQGTGRMH